jgi:hypothetical protein
MRGPCTSCHRLSRIGAFPTPFPFWIPPERAPELYLGSAPGVRGCKCTDSHGGYSAWQHRSSKCSWLGPDSRESHSPLLSFSCSAGTRRQPGRVEAGLRLFLLDTGQLRTPELLIQQALVGPAHSHAFQTASSPSVGCAIVVFYNKSFGLLCFICLYLDAGAKIGMPCLPIHHAPAEFGVSRPMQVAGRVWRGLNLVACTGQSSRQATLSATLARLSLSLTRAQNMQA